MKYNKDKSLDDLTEEEQQEIIDPFIEEMIGGLATIVKID